MTITPQIQEQRIRTKDRTIAEYRDAYSDLMDRHKTLRKRVQMVGNALRLNANADAAEAAAEDLRIILDDDYEEGF